MTSAAEQMPSSNQAWRKPGVRTFLVAWWLLLIASAVAGWMAPRVDFVLGQPMPRSGDMGLMNGAFLLLVLWAFWRPPPTRGQVVAVCLAVLLIVALGFGRAVHQEGLIRQTEADVAVWYGAHCRPDDGNAACLQYLAVFQGICDISRPENACVRRLAPFLEEARARMTGATMP